jgi:hypothetical protein
VIPIPHAKPDASWPLWRDRLIAAGHDVENLIQLPLFVCAVRGLFSRTIAPEGNNLQAYDDAIAVIRPVTGGTPVVTTWNANTDPSRYGWNKNAGKYMARLQPGLWWFRERLHGGRYRAFGQSNSPVTVDRVDATGAVRETETGCFGIDLHPGGHNSTSSEGCQTVPPDTWAKLYDIIYKRAKKDAFPYILMDA